MEKLKAKHDHKLTDILKVAIFGLMLILPGLILLPSMLYYGVNEHATAPTEQVEKIEYERVDFNQIVDEDLSLYNIGVTISFTNDKINFSGLCTETAYFGTTISQITSKQNHKYYIRSNDYDNNFIPSFTLGLYSNGWVNNCNVNEILTASVDNGNFSIIIYSIINTNYNSSCYLQLYDLTQMFGAGKEPTAQQFNTWYPNDYYEYTESRYEVLEKPTGTYETYTDITSQIQYNWNSLWQQPLFSWTNYTIVKQGIDNFTGVFGITNTSNISNLIAYELIIVAIYIVIDIVLTLFKWLTHLIGEK